MGWLGWAGLAGLGWAGLQRADLRSAEIFHTLRPRPVGCGAAANQSSDWKKPHLAGVATQCENRLS